MDGNALVPSLLFELCIRGLSRAGYVIYAAEKDGEEQPDRMQVVCECCGSVVLQADAMSNGLWAVYWYGDYRQLYRWKIVNAN